MKEEQKIGFGLVLRAIAKKDDKLLLLQRPSKSSHDNGRWELPGGKIKKGEFFDEGLRRDYYQSQNSDARKNGGYVNAYRSQAPEERDYRGYVACRTSKKSDHAPTSRCLWFKPFKYEHRNRCDADHEKYDRDHLEKGSEVDREVFVYLINVAEYSAPCLVYCFFGTLRQKRNDRRIYDHQEYKEQNDPSYNFL